MTDNEAIAEYVRAHIPEGVTITQVERMSDAFCKYHLDDGRVMHLFTAPDEGDPHDHPWSFRSTILAGGYVEQAYTLLPEGDWRSVLLYRYPGASHDVAAQSIHRIVSLLEGKCLTLIEPGPWEQQPGFWRLHEGKVQRRQWNEDWPA